MSLLNADQAAELLNVPPSWVLAEARADRIPHVRLGRYVRFEAQELDGLVIRAPVIHWRPQPRRTRTPPGGVYFIQCIGPGHPIKIGYAKNVAQRLAEHQCSSPYELRLIRAVPGPRPLEREMHRRFAEDRLRGEWFKPSTDLLRFAHHCETYDAGTGASE